MIRKFKNILHGYQAVVASFLFGRPGRKIFTIGVTGTDGKTTTASLIFHILKTAGFNPAMITTVVAQIGKQSYETGLHTTTPSAFTLQKYIKKAVGEKCDYLILEATSHALDQNRVHGIDFKIGVLTNISHDHLDYHKTYENYVEAKTKLFCLSDISILNQDDKSYRIIKDKLIDKTILSYSVQKPDANFSLKSVNVSFPGQFDFNIENFLAAVSVAKTIGIPDEKIAAALKTFQFPAGRQEIVYEKEFRVIIDFAHTPNSFEKVLPALKKATAGRLIHVFGSAGERDASKRPLMGSVSAKYSDQIILTAEDPRSESVESINAQIKLGISDFKGEIVEILDRQEAINFAIQSAQRGDTVVITGKGHEQSMNLGRGEIPWSDHTAVEKALAKEN